jgi:ABC-2 type transport system ATP-binding protein
VLILDQLCKTYANHRAVHQVSITIPKGEIWGFLGVNGAGKTTTMKMIAGLLKPTSGTISVDGISVFDSPLQAKSLIGYIPDRPYLYERLTALEYLYFIGKLYQIPKDEIENCIEKWLAEFELSSVADQWIESFSHGMKQRLVMASVFMHQPKLLVVDEPMVGLDPRGSRHLKELLLKQKEEYGLTVLLSTHTLEVAEEICDQILLIHQGEILTQGTATDLKNQEDERLEHVFLRLTEEEIQGDFKEREDHSK